ncbi:hypothetical protein [Vibrio phage vB_VmeM-Yong XC32]|nr:hypothetical protein [Vibrio phage vB_VmeM-Yong XC31]QAX96500.1 hypothetical protein [Vibrio phage vB_VmeM-Yong XC32]QAX96817.1 hypothetical protein [Vibrio phage vB_VmeM-Yong MS31]QAX97136.1 hypothetical protein [Vibrio phage vB_VmeM-Yong MS32]
MQTVKLLRRQPFNRVMRNPIETTYGLPLFSVPAEDKYATPQLSAYEQQKEWLDMYCSRSSIMLQWVTDQGVLVSTGTGLACLEEGNQRTVFVWASLPYGLDRSKLTNIEVQAELATKDGTIQALPELKIHVEKINDIIP